MLLELIASGFFIGLLVGATGVGGGSLMAPLLVMFFKIDPLVAVGTDLLYNAPTKILGAWIHARAGTLNLSLAISLSAGGALGLGLGWLLLHYFEARYNVGDFAALLRHWIGVAVCLSAILTILPSVLRKRPSPHQEIAPNPFLLVAIGTLVGVIVMATSIGAGAVTLPLLVLIRRYSIRTIVGSDLAFSAFITVLASLIHYGRGDVNLGLGMILLAGSIPGVIVGSRFSSLNVDRILRPTVGTVLLLVGLRML